MSHKTDLLTLFTSHYIAEADDDLALERIAVIPPYTSPLICRDAATIALGLQCVVKELRVIAT